MTGPNPRAATPTRRDRTAQSVFAPRQADHDASPGLSTAGTAGPAQPAISAPPTSEPLLLTVAQAAQRLGISRSLLYELLATGDIESITIGRLRRIPADALSTYVQLQRARSHGPRI
jgi:excisionase family DNA binding protein